MKPNILIDAYRLAWFSIAVTRGRAIYGILTTSNFMWNENGEVEPSYDSPELAVAIEKLQVGFQPDWREVMRETAMKFATGEAVNRPRESEEEVRQAYFYRLRSMLEERRREWPTSVSLFRNDVILNVPANVTNEWREVCVEFCEMVLALPEWTLDTALTRSEIRERDRKFKGEGKPSWLEKVAPIVAEVMGPLTEEQIAKLDEVAQRVAREQFNAWFRGTDKRVERLNSELRDAKTSLEQVLRQLKQ